MFLPASLQARARGGKAGNDWLPDAGGARVIGNGLRELDRFLCLLLDEAMRGVAPLCFDHRGYARRTNAAAKLRDFHKLAGIAAADEQRLRAIGRVRDCLHHCRGIVHDPALYGDLGRAARAAPNGGGPRLQIAFDDLAGICNFYAECGAVVRAVSG
jgi:hypothetical protein